MAEVKHVTGADFEAEVLKSDVPVMVDFWAPWCGPCRMVGPVLEEIAKEFDGRAKVCKVNVDEEQELARTYRIMNIPAVFVFRGGEIAAKQIGARPKEDFADMLAENL